MVLSFDAAIVRLVKRHFCSATYICRQTLRRRLALDVQRLDGLVAGQFIGRYVFPDGELPHLALVPRRSRGPGWR